MKTKTKLLRPEMLENGVEIVYAAGYKLTGRSANKLGKEIPALYLLCTFLWVCHALNSMIGID